MNVAKDEILSEFMLKNSTLLNKENGCSALELIIGGQCDGVLFCFDFSDAQRYLVSCYRYATE